MGPLSNKRLTFEEFELESRTHLLTRQGLPVHLPKKPFGVLLYLIENRDRLVTRSELLNEFWGGHDVYEETLTKCVGTIRKALDDRSEVPRFIQTQWAEGYRFIHSVEEHAVAEIERMREVKITIEEEDEKLRTLGAVLSSRKAIVLVSLVFLALVVAAVTFRQTRLAAGETSRGPVRSLAVLPLYNSTGDPANDYISDGVTESLITSLSKIDGLKVIARGSTFGYRQPDIDPLEVGKRLDVEAVLTGAVLRDQNALKISAKLISTADGSVIWAGETYGHDGQDIFALQNQVVRETVTALRGKLELSKLGNDVARNVDPEAYRLYLQGRYFWNKRSGDGLNKGIQYFKAAIEKDPDFALAYAGLADCYSLLSYYAAARPDETFPLAKAAAQNALKLDDSLAEVHASLALIVVWYDLNWELADKEYRRAIELNPNYATAHHWYGNFLVLRKRHDESIAEMKKAQALDPLSLSIATDVGMAYFFARRYDEAMSQLGHVLDLDPNYSMAHFFLAWSHQQKGEYDEAVAGFERAVELLPEKTETRAMLIQAYVTAGQREKAERAFAVLQKKVGDGSPFAMALAYKGLGKRDLALQELERCYKERDNGLTEMGINPILDDLRSEPRFHAILKKVGHVE